jgi:hypothetical protein
MSARIGELSCAMQCHVSKVCLPTVCYCVHVLLGFIREVAF